MATYPLTKTKRKGLGDVNEDFSEFSLSAPAKKIRRLDAELQPIVEEELPDISSQFYNSPPQFGASNGFQPQLSEPVIEELPPSPSNDERAIVLFNPLSSTPRLDSTPTFYIHSDLVSSMRNHGFWRANSTRNATSSIGDDDEEDSIKSDNNLAVVPWNPSQQQVHQKLTLTELDNDLSVPMESDDMEIEQTSEDNNAVRTYQISPSNEGNVNWMMSNDGMTQQQWQQQHCMIPQLPQNTSSPVVWYR